MSFRQVPYVSVYARVEKGAAVRKHLRKYLESSAASHAAMSQHLLNDAHVASMQPDEISKTCMDDVFRMLHKYNHTVGTKSLEVSKTLMDLAAPLDNSGKLRKWNKDTYNLIVGTSFPHVAIARASAAAEDLRAACQEYDDAKSALHSAIEHRDDMVEGATEASQMAEDDRLETTTLILQQFVQVRTHLLDNEVVTLLQAKQSALLAEMDALREFAGVVKQLDRSATLQQYIVDHMQPDITHRHSKALFLVEWHWKWHLERMELAKAEPDDYLNMTSDSIRCLYEHNITVYDVEVMKEFVASCFVQPDLSRMVLQTKIPTKHRHRFVDATAGRALYKLDVVRNVIVAALNHQRAFGVDLTVVGYEMLVAALNLLLQGCLDRGDTKCAKSVMNMAQTFYCIHKQTKHYLLTNLVMHPMWQTAHFWGDAVLLSIGEELSRHPMDTPWQCLSAPARAALVVTVHNVVFGQLTTFVYNMAAFRLSRRQIRQFVQNVAFSFELSEDQRMALLAAVASLSMDESKDDEERAILGGDASLFTTAIFPEWRKTAPPKDSSMHVLVGQGLSRIKGIFDRDLDKASSQVLLANAQVRTLAWNSHLVTCGSSNLLPTIFRLHM
ncbi:hypothetical protein DYB32_009385 [Aphanomyces invadans]|uniref:SBF1/SBF2 domain-containing protein n=1 Tax=Aphanomyces invadans TaxID=157072 RepID=A0A418AIR7_9STRA|nr:hypothetical protein DYB32_009385 [Aphanomyces invadans]